MKSIDLHGYKVADTEKFFYDQLNAARLKSTLVEVMCITGTGVIRERLLALAKENDLNHYVPMSNRGCIVIEFE